MAHGQLPGGEGALGDSRESGRRCFRGVRCGAERGQRFLHNLLDPAEIERGGNRETILIPEIGQDGGIAAQRRGGISESGGIDVQVAVLAKPTILPRLSRTSLQPARIAICMVIGMICRTVWR